MSTSELKSSIILFLKSNKLVSLSKVKNPKNKYFKLKQNIINHTKFLDKNNKKISFADRVYCILHDISEWPKCQCGCGKELNHIDRKFLPGHGTKTNEVQEKFKNTCKERYGTESPFKNKEIKEKIEQTNLKKYGVKYPLQSKEIREKGEQTNLERYGVKYTFQVPEVKKKIDETMLEKYGTTIPIKNEKIKEKIEQTNLERRGVKYPLQSKEVQEKCKETWIEKYGEDNPNKDPAVRRNLEQTNLERYGVKYTFQVPEVQEKIAKTNKERYGAENVFASEYGKNKCKETWMEKYGEDNPMKNPEIFGKNKKSRYKFKEYKFPSGKIEKVQGFEPYAIDILLESYDENDIIVDNTEIEKLIGKIEYIGEDNKKHIYFPDIYIKSENKIIEVKSIWTFKMDEINNKLKMEACKEKGLKFEFWILNEKGKIEEIIKINK